VTVLELAQDPLFSIRGFLLRMNILWQGEWRCIVVSRDTLPLIGLILRKHGRDPDGASGGQFF
jgi:hypothetical protein